MEDPSDPSNASQGEGTLEVKTTQLGTRLDSWLNEQLADLTRGNIRRWIDEGHILVNGQKVKPSHKPKAGERITITPPAIRPMDLIPEVMPLAILFEDKHLMVVNKPPGLVVHPAAGHATGTLVHGILHHCKGQLSGIGDVARPGIVHRLDQDTSGCMVIAKTDAAHQGLTMQFARRSVTKVYTAVVCGNLLPGQNRIQAPIARHPTQRKLMSVVDGGRLAVTDYKVREYFGTLATWVEVRLHTGRTHQIRVHFKYLGFPLFGDASYGKRSSSRLTETSGFTPPRQLLHAWKLGFDHPATGKALLFEAPIPEDFQEAVTRLSNAPQCSPKNVQG